MKTCIEPGCDRPAFAKNLCKYHQFRRYMKGGDLYKSRPRKRQKPIPKESKKRKGEHIRYTDQRKAFIQKCKDEGKYYCYLCLEPFDQSSDTRYCTIEHSLGRVGDNYRDEKHWRLMHCECNYNLEHKTIAWFKKQPYWNDFLERLKKDDRLAWERIQRKIEKSEDKTELFD